MVVTAVRGRGKLLFGLATLRQVVLRPGTEAFVATVSLSLQVFFGTEVYLLTNLRREIQPNLEKSNSVKKREKRTTEA
jgi:hypothetical protein